MTKCQFMSVLLVTATDFEVPNCQFGEGVRHIVTGMGPGAAGAVTAGELARGSYDLVVNAGIAGAADHSLVLGEVVAVTRDRFADLGVWRQGNEGGAFVPLDNTIYIGLDVVGLRSVEAATVSTACSPLTDLTGAHIESMEGAAVMLAAAREGVPVVQLRAVSNYLETPRDQWQIHEAVEALNVALTFFLKRVI